MFCTQQHSKVISSHFYNLLAINTCNIANCKLVWLTNNWTNQNENWRNFIVSTDLSVNESFWWTVKTWKNVQGVERYRFHVNVKICRKSPKCEHHRTELHHLKAIGTAIIIDFSAKQCSGVLNTNLINIIKLCA